MKKSVLVPAALLAALLGAIFLFFAPHKLQQETAVVAPITAPVADPVSTAPHYPLIPTPETAPEQAPETREGEIEPAATAATEDADTLRTRLLTLLGGPGEKSKLLILENFIPRFVVTIDNLTNRDLPRKQLPVKGAPGSFQVQGTLEEESIHPANALRYTSFVELAESFDSRELVNLYARLYPEFQKAYENLGKPDSYFNDRLIAVIDHLLATPEPAEPIRLQRPKILYQYADAELERRSSGQKILLRVGAENRARIKSKLSECRAELLKRVSTPTLETPAR
ncbi:DUF3014 domain-containing protein [Trichloromonas sp.]|uniref:DUF3014 domain-containing protein n=1 Tax=Trichloromonas sp. TaxID=3069249 RepID=UPI002A47B664|nr:DUF3014 domain-containing protein [Trichloromonas sp.]